MEAAGIVTMLDGRGRPEISGHRGDGERDRGACAATVSPARSRKKSPCFILLPLYRSRFAAARRAD